MLLVLVGITLIAYMIAINARGAIRLTVSYLLATAMLAVVVWSLTYQINLQREQSKLEAFKTLQAEKAVAEKTVHSQEAQLMENRLHSKTTAALVEIISEGKAQATFLSAVDLRELSLDINALIARADAGKRKSLELKAAFEKIQIDDSLFIPIRTQIREAISAVIESASYHSLYYRSEDSPQEELREKVLRQRAKAALEKFGEAGVLLSTIS